MAITRLSGGVTPGDGADPRTFPAIWNATADDLEAGDYSRVPTGGSAGQVLVKDSATDFDANWAFSQFLVKPVANRWVSVLLASQSTGRQFTNEALLFIPIAIRQPVTVDRMQILVDTAEAGVVARLGLYENNDGTVGSLIVDAGTVDCSTTGFKEVTINETLPSGIVWAAFVPNGSTGTLRIRGNFDQAIIKVSGGNAPNAASGAGCLQQTGVSGALPDPPIAGFGEGREVPVVGLRVSAVL
jgi:hypothetical protein